MKNITLTVVKRTTKKVQFRVANSHRNDEFNPLGSDKQVFCSKSGMRLYSTGFPDAVDGALYLKGCVDEEDDNLLEAAPSKFKEYEAAVLEYNALYTDKPVEVGPKLEIEVLETSSWRDDVAFRIKSHSGFKRHSPVSANKQNFTLGDSGENHASSFLVNFDGGNCVFVVSRELLSTIEANIATLNAPKPLKTITFLYPKGGGKERRILNVTVENPDSYEGIDPDNSGYRKFLKSKMSQVKEVK